MLKPDTWYKITLEGSNSYVRGLKKRLKAEFLQRREEALTTEQYEAEYATLYTPADGYTNRLSEKEEIYFSPEAVPLMLPEILSNKHEAVTEAGSIPSEQFAP